jgi:S-formylglutathione hydrolase
MVTVKSSVRLFGGVLQRMTHLSSVCKCEMTFAVYMPPKSDSQPVPVLYWLSGLTCTDENFSQKSGFARAAAARGVALVMPDTSPRGVDIEGADDSYDFGSGAGFYVDATEPKWAEHYVRHSPPTDFPCLHAHFAPQTQSYTILPLIDTVGVMGALLAPRQSMYTYVTSELPALIEATFAGKLTGKKVRVAPVFLP